MTRVGGDFAPRPHLRTTLPAAKKIVSSGTRDRWQSQWDKCSKAQALHEFRPHIPISGYHSITNHIIEKRLFWLKSGYTHLNSELFKYGNVDTPTCPCGLEEETVPHLLLNCPLTTGTEARDAMVTKIETGYIKRTTEPHLRSITTNTLLGANYAIKPQMKSVIDYALIDFVKSIPHPFYTPNPTVHKL